jgi:hypothetical protein
VAFVALTDAETDASKPARQALWKKIKDNFDDHQSRLGALEGGSADILFDHFTRDSRAIGGASHLPSADRFTRVTAGGGTVTLLTTDHICRLAIAASGDIAGLRANMRLKPPQLPKMVMRMKVSSWATTGFEFFAGMGDDTSTAGYGDAFAGNGPDNGVYLEISGSNLIFVAEKGASRTNGTAFGQPSTGTWFEIDIKYLDTDSVECRFDGALKSTFNGPTDFVPDALTHNIYAGAWMAGGASVAAHNYDIDRLRSELGTIVDAA